MKITIFCMILSLFTAQTWGAKQSDAFKVTKSELSNEMEIQVTDQLCNKNKMFSDCYGWKKPDCKKNVKLNLKTCTGTKLTKKYYDLIDDGPKLFEVIGECLESRISKLHKSNRAACKQYTNYLM